MIRNGGWTLGITLAGLLLVLPGCETKAQTGTLAGAGIGALIGQAAGGDTGATLIGAAIGAGVGHMIGNAEDKKHAETMSRGQQEYQYGHSEVGELGGTRWMVVSLSPRDAAPPYTSKVLDFQPNGRVITTTTKPDGSVDIFDEHYRVVGSTLIVNKPGYLINAKFSISGGEMVVDSDEFRAVLRRL